MSSEWIAPIFAGLLGTTALTVAVCLPEWLGIKHVNMVRALGVRLRSDKDSERGLVPGVFLHYAIGIFFAWVYLVGFQIMGVPFNALTGALVGTVHGGLAMFVVERIIFKRRPQTALPKGENPVVVADNQARVAASAQFVGHTFYGLIVVGIYQLLQTRPRFAGLLLIP